MDHVRPAQHQRGELLIRKATTTESCIFSWEFGDLKWICTATKALFTGRPGTGHGGGERSSFSHVVRIVTDRLTAIAKTGCSPLADFDDLSRHHPYIHCLGHGLG